MRTCTRCGISKAAAAFASRRKDRGSLQSWCRECHKAHAAERYRRRTPEQVRHKREVDRLTVAAIRRQVWEYLRGRWCIDCGETDVVVLEFDHIGTKSGNVSDLVKNGSWSSVLGEIQHCEVRCANCHRRRTRAGLAARPDGALPRLRPGRDSNARHTDSKSVALSAELPGLDHQSIGAEALLCGRCRIVKSTSAFAWRIRDRGIRQPWCRDCHNAQKRLFYALNRNSEIARARTRQLALIAANAPRLRAFLECHPCVDCGERDVSVLEFDHLRDKRKDVTTMLWSGLLWSTIEQEIAKCEVRCANCHRRRTARERGYEMRKRGLAETALPYGNGGEAASPARFERAATCSVGRCSIH